MCLCGVCDNAEDPGTTAKQIDVDHHDFAKGLSERLKPFPSTIIVFSEISKGPYKNHKANQLFIYVTTLEHRQKLLLGSNSKVFKINILCVQRNYRRFGGVCFSKKELRGITVNFIAVG